MSDLSIALAQVAVLVAIGYCTGHRLLLAVVALAGAAGAMWLGHPAPMSAAWTDIATTTLGIAVGAVLGWWAIGAREKRLSTADRQRELLSTAAERARALARRRTRIRALAALDVAAVAGAALHHFEPERVHAGYAALQPRLAARVALVAPAPAAKSPAVRASAGASPSSADAASSATSTSTRSSTGSQPFGSTMWRPSSRPCSTPFSNSTR
jgi:hypothetical protein